MFGGIWLSQQRKFSQGARKNKTNETEVARKGITNKQTNKKYLEEINF